MHPQHAHLDPFDPTDAGDRTCECERPRTQVRAERKWAATSYCLRCGYPLPLTWR